MRPYTITLLDEGIYNIVDGNNSNPCGVHLGENEPMTSQMRFLDTNFKFGTATITWNK